MMPDEAERDRQKKTWIPALDQAGGRFCAKMTEGSPAAMFERIGRITSETLVLHLQE